MYCLCVLCKFCVVCVCDVERTCTFVCGGGGGGGGVKKVLQRTHLRGQVCECESFKSPYVQVPSTST